MNAGKGQGAKLSFGLLAFSIFTLACAVLFAALGIWQLERLGWKNELVAAVESRSTAPPSDLNNQDWSALDLTQSEYLRVSAVGQFEGVDTFTQAVTVHGGGFWTLTPLRLADGRSILINRGFVTSAQRDAGVPRPRGEMTVTGLLRLTEPDGGFLRANDPLSGRWYSRDIAEIGASYDDLDVSPFFVDADPSAEPYPIGGLTVLSFPNNHLVYALTWFGLTLLCLGGFGFVVRDRLRRHA